MDTKKNVQRIEKMIQTCGCDPTEAIIVLSTALDNAARKWREERNRWYVNLKNEQV